MRVDADLVAPVVVDVEASEATPGAVFDEGDCAATVILTPLSVRSTSYLGLAGTHTLGSGTQPMKSWTLSSRWIVKTAGSSRARMPERVFCSRMAIL